MFRRSVLLLPLTLLPHPARAEAGAPEAIEFIRESGAELAAVTGASAGPEREERLAQLLERIVDLDGVARFCLGRYWRSTNDRQQREYLRLFRLVLLRGVVSRLGDYQPGSATIVMKTPVAQPDGILVPTVVVRTGNSPVNISWLVSVEGSKMRIEDVIAEGMSLRITQRSDYGSYLAHNGGDLDKLLAGMRAQVSE